MSEAYIGGGGKTLTRMNTTVEFTWASVGGGNYDNMIKITLPVGFDEKDIDSFCAIVPHGNDIGSRSVSKVGGKWWYMYQTAGYNGIFRQITNITQSGQILIITYTTDYGLQVMDGTYVGYWNK